MSGSPFKRRLIRGCHVSQTGNPGAISLSLCLCCLQGLHRIPCLTHMTAPNKPSLEGAPTHMPVPAASAATLARAPPESGRPFVSALAMRALRRGALGLFFLKKSFRAACAHR